MTIAIGQAMGPIRQTTAAEINTGRRNRPATGSVTASARPRAATSDDSDTGRASRNSFSGDPARTASALAARAARLPNATVVMTSASAASCPTSTVFAITANACPNSPTYASPVATATTTANSVVRPRPRARNALRIERRR